MPEDQRIFLGLGSNIDDKYVNLLNCITCLDNHPHIWVLNKSYIYETSPMYNIEQENFYNMVVEIETNFIPMQLLKETQKIEKIIGREYCHSNNMPRIIDIDILAFGELIISSQLLSVPHPKIIERKFVLKPWNDIAPSFCLPNIGLVSDLLENTKDKTSVRRLLIINEKNNK